MLSANTEISPLFFAIHPVLKGIYPASKGTVSLWSDDMDLILRIKIFLFFYIHKSDCFFFAILSHALWATGNIVGIGMSLVCQEECSGVNARGQTVHQRPVGCRLCILSNWVSSKVLLKICLFSQCRPERCEVCLRSTVKGYSSVSWNAWCSHSETAAWFPLQICTDAKWLCFHSLELHIK